MSLGSYSSKSLVVFRHVFNLTKYCTAPFIWHCRIWIFYNNAFAENMISIRTIHIQVYIITLLYQNNFSEIIQHFIVLGKSDDVEIIGPLVIDIGINPLFYWDTFFLGRDHLCFLFAVLARDFLAGVKYTAMRVNWKRNRLDPRRS